MCEAETKVQTSPPHPSPKMPLLSRLIRVQSRASYSTASHARTSEGPIAVLRGATLGGNSFIPKLALGAGESWLVTGPAGSGKSLLSGLLAGRPGEIDPIRYSSDPIGSSNDSSKSQPELFLHPKLSTRLLDFREDSSAFTYAGHYLQERYESLSLDGDNFQRRGGKGELDLFGFLLSGLSTEDFDPDAASSEQIKQREAKVWEMMDRVNLPRSKADLLFMKLSNGQSRRARIGRMLLQLQVDAEEDKTAVAERRSLLLLDEPYVGLDRWSRARIEELVGSLVNSHRSGHGQAGLSVVMFTRDPRTPSIDPSKPGQVPNWISHVAELEAKPTPHLAWSGSKDEFVRRLSAKISTTKKTSVAISSTTSSDEAPFIALRNIQIAYPSAKNPDGSLRHVSVIKNLTWELKRGEKWGLLGPNGSGKSTLLSLLTADHPQAYSNTVIMFGIPRKQLSIWDVKKKVGYTSPEMLLYLPNLIGKTHGHREGGMTLNDVLRSAWTRDPFDPPLTDEDRAEIGRSIDLLVSPFKTAGLLPELKTPFARLSTTQQRLVLFLRSFAGSPELVILDEPWQGMDETAVELCRHWVDWWCEGASDGSFQFSEETKRKGANLTMIVTTHDWERELPSSVTRLAWLKMVETPEGDEVNDGITVERIR